MIAISLPLAFGDLVIAMLCKEAHEKHINVEDFQFYGAELFLGSVGRASFASIICFVLDSVSMRQACQS